MRYHRLASIVAGFLLLATALHSLPASAEPAGWPAAEPAGPHATTAATGVAPETPGAGSETMSGLVAEQIYAGAAVAGGAFVIGIVATGSLASGLAAATAVAIAYGFMP